MPSSPFGHPHALSDCYATWYISKKADELAGTSGFAPDEADDISQELTLHLLERWSSFDDAKGKVTTFIANLVDAKVVDLVRSRQCLHCDYQRNEALTEDAEFGLLDGIRGQPEVSDFERIDLRIDCDKVLAGLPGDLQELAELLKQMTLTEAARHLGVPTTTLSYRLGKLRRHFATAGFGHGDNFADFEDEETE